MGAQHRHIHAFAALTIYTDLGARDHLMLDELSQTFL